MYFKDVFAFVFQRRIQTTLPLEVHDLKKFLARIDLVQVINTIFRIWVAFDPFWGRIEGMKLESSFWCRWNAHTHFPKTRELQSFRYLYPFSYNYYDKCRKKRFSFRRVNLAANKKSKQGDLTFYGGFTETREIHISDELRTKAVSRKLRLRYVF